MTPNKDDRLKEDIEVLEDMLNYPDGAWERSGKEAITRMVALTKRVDEEKIAKLMYKTIFHGLEGIENHNWTMYKETAQAICAYLRGGE